MDHDIEKVALLREPIRRKLFDHVRSSGEPVSREEAASAVGVSRSLAAFHLDKLADGGLLEVEYRRLSGRSGRGAGRPAKLYRPTAHRLAVTFPPTRYELAARLLIEALQSKTAGEAPEAAARRSAERRGRELARELGARTRRRGGRARVREALGELGFEPEEEEGAILLHNCPFHELMRAHPDIVCDMNGAFVGALADELAPGEARTAPCDREGYCCVMVERA